MDLLAVRSKRTIKCFILNGGLGWLSLQNGSNAPKKMHLKAKIRGKLNVNVMTGISKVFLQNVIILNSFTISMMLLIITIYHISMVNLSVHNFINTYLTVILNMD